MVCVWVGGVCVCVFFGGGRGGGAAGGGIIWRRRTLGLFPPPLSCTTTHGPPPSPQPHSADHLHTPPTWQMRATVSASSAW